METELWSRSENRIYTEGNATLLNINGVFVLATPKGEPLLSRVR